MIIVWPTIWENDPYRHSDWNHKMYVLPKSGIFMYNGEAWGRAELHDRPNIPLSRSDLMRAGSWPHIRSIGWARDHAWMDIEMLSINDGIHMNGRLYFHVQVYRIMPDIYLFHRFIRVARRHFRKRMLAFGMMGHARLGKACALGGDLEVVGIMLRYMRIA